MVKIFSGKIFSCRYPFGKRPPPPKEKGVFDQFYGEQFTCENQGKAPVKTRPTPMANLTNNVNDLQNNLYFFAY